MSKTLPFDSSFMEHFVLLTRPGIPSYQEAVPSALVPELLVIVSRLALFLIHRMILLSYIKYLELAYAVIDVDCYYYRFS